MRPVGRGALPPRWSEAELEADRRAAIAAFRRERLDEPAEAYGRLVDRQRAATAELLGVTADLAQLEQHGLEVLTSPSLRAALRYLTGPPISEDDLKTLVDAGSLSPQRLRADPGLVSAVLGVIRAALDRRRFAWVESGRSAGPEEREAAIVATAALAAVRGLEAQRRTQGKSTQEEAVRAALVALGFQQARVPNASAQTLADVPPAGHFAGETAFGDRRADLLVRLGDGRVMPIECKVSNSSVNSIKRLNNDTAAKAADWIAQFGGRNVVPVAVLAGVYDLRSLIRAQERGLTIIWSHRLTDLTRFVEQTRAEERPR